MPRSYLVLFNIAKTNNLGNLIRTADALGVHEVIVVGRRRYRTLGAFGTARTTRQRHFHSLPLALEYLREVGARLVGIEIAPDSLPVDDEPFEGDTAFLVGNEGTGLSDAQLEACERIVHVPQFGACASLNVNVAAGIVLHRFAAWAGFPPNSRDGHKFIPPEDSRPS